MSGGHRRTQRKLSGSRASGQGTSTRSSGTSSRGTARRRDAAFTVELPIASGIFICPICSTITPIAASAVARTKRTFTPHTVTNSGWFSCPACEFRSNLFVQEDETDESDHASDDPEGGDYKDPFRPRTPPPSTANRTYRAVSYFAN